MKSRSVGEWAFVATVSVLFLGGNANAAESTRDASKILDQLQACATIIEPLQRVACYDGQILILKEAREKDRNFLARTEKQKFAPVDATVTSVAELQPGVWLLVLTDHSVWRTDDDVRFFPKAGEHINVYKGAVGSYFARIGKERAVRVKPMR